MFFVLYFLIILLSKRGSGGLTPEPLLMAVSPALFVDLLFRGEDVAVLSISQGIFLYFLPAIITPKVVSFFLAVEVKFV